MRSSKYHDYPVLKVILIIILLALGLFAYRNCQLHSQHVASENTWETVKEATCTESGVRCKVCTECGEKFDHTPVPAKGHGEPRVVEENKVAPTCTEGGSYVKVVYCEDCDEKLHTENVQVDCLPHNPATTAKRENINNSTHTVAGSYDLVTRCKDCNEVVSSESKTIEPTGHNYSIWELEFIEEVGAFIMTAKCNCNEPGNEMVLTESDGLVIVIDDTSPVCVSKKYIGTFTYEGKTIKRVVEVAADSHRLYEVEVEGVGTIYVTADSCAKYDEKYGLYFDLDTQGIFLVVDEYKGETAESVWDENGFAVGTYKCTLCNEWRAVVVYSAEYDTRINTEA